MVFFSLMIFMTLMWCVVMGLQCILLAKAEHNKHYSLSPSLSVTISRCMPFTA